MADSLGLNDPVFVDGEGDHPGAGQLFALLDHPVVVQGGKDHVRDGIQVQQGLHIDLEQALAGGGEIDFSFLGVGQGESRSGGGYGNAAGGVVLVDLAVEAGHEDVFLAQVLEDLHVFLGDEVALAEAGPLENVRDDLGDVVSQDGAHSLVNGDGLDFVLFKVFHGVSPVRVWGQPPRLGLMNSMRSFSSNWVVS